MLRIRSLPLPFLALWLAGALLPAADDAGFSPASDPTAVTAVCHAVAAWQVAHPAKHNQLDWTQAAWYIGLDTWGEVSGGQRWLDHLRRIGAAVAWTPAPHVGLADDHAVSQTWLNFYLRDRIPAQLTPTRELMAKFTAHEPGDLAWETKPANRDWAWCDALFMSPPVLAQLATVTGQRSWLEALDRFWWHTVDYLYSKDEHLFFRDSRFFTKVEANGKKVFWSRGNGWVFAGLVHILQNLPSDHPSRGRYEELFREMGERLVGLQTPDGTWHASLLDPDAFTSPESSGTAFFTYGLLWGVDQGLLPADRCLPAALKAWKALVGHVQPDGKLGYVQAVGFSPTQVDKDSVEVYGPGAFLLAGSQLLTHVTLEGAKRARVVVHNRLDQPRVREVTSLPWAEVQRLLPGIAPEQVAVRNMQTGRLVPVQVFAAHADGKPDELLFLATLMPKASGNYELIQLAGAQPKALPSRLFARFVPERKDDFAWENDRIAHRTYGPAIAKEGTRDGLDVWCKRTRELVIDRWYAQGKYHLDVGEGCDCYHTGDTLGCGGFGYLDATGKITTSPVYATHQLISSGPLRLAFVLTYAPQTFGGATITETKRIQMDLGDDVFRVDASWVVRGDPTGLTGVAGIRAMPGATVPPGANVVTAFIDAEGGVAKNGQIGQALILPTGVPAMVNQEHVYGVVTKDFASPVTWYAGASWTKGLDFATPETWTARTAATAARMAAPLVATAP